MRPEWDDYFMEIAQLVSTRSTCLRRKVGAVLTRENHIISTGYNGAASGLAHCEEVGCLRDTMDVPSGERHELCRGLHAEQNAIIQAAVHGGGIAGSTLYCTDHPCVLCAKMLVNAGIVKVIYLNGYPDELSRDIFAEAGVEIIQYGKTGKEADSDGA